MQRIVHSSGFIHDISIMREIERNADSLMVDKYGNYFMSTLVNHVHGSSRLQLLSSISHFIQVATNSRGTHVLQSLVKGIESQAEEDKILDLLKAAGIKHLVKNQNSVHVLI